MKCLTVLGDPVYCIRFSHCLFPDKAHSAPGRKTIKTLPQSLKFTTGDRWRGRGPPWRTDSSTLDRLQALIASSSPGHLIISSPLHHPQRSPCLRNSATNTSCFCFRLSTWVMNRYSDRGVLLFHFCDCDLFSLLSEGARGELQYPN